MGEAFSSNDFQYSVDGECVNTDAATQYERVVKKLPAHNMEPPNILLHFAAG